MKDKSMIIEMIKQLRVIQADQQHMENIYTISDQINALQWVLDIDKTIQLSSCTCRFKADLK